MASVTYGATGINFSDYQPAAAAGSMSSELLDKYEEGSWTPAPSAGSLTISEVPQYTKIGRSCFVSTYIYNHTTNTSAAWVCGGLPFAVMSGVTTYGSAQWYHYDPPSVLLTLTIFANSGEGLGAHYSLDNANWARVLYNQLQDAHIGLAISYHTAT